MFCAGKRLCLDVQSRPRSLPFSCMRDGREGAREVGGGLAAVASRCGKSVHGVDILRQLGCILTVWTG